MVSPSKEAIYQLIDKYGFTLAFAIVALLLFMGLLPSPLSDVAKIVPEINKKADSIMVQHSDGQNVLKAICLNTSKSDEQRSRCLE